MSIEEFKGNLRLRWRYDGKRYVLSLGLQTTNTNKALAQLKAAEIEKDIKYSMFDVTLEKYKGNRSGRSLLISDVFEKFIEFKRDKVYPQTLTKYSGLLTSIKDHFKLRQAGSLTATDCDRFRVYLSNRLVPRTVKEQLGLMTAVWDWAIDTRRLPAPNPWKGIAKSVKRIPRPST